MSKDVRRLSSGTSIDEIEAYINQINRKDDQLTICDLNREITYKRLDAEKKRVRNEICYIKWFDKKSKELTEKRHLKFEEERLKQEAEILEKKNQAKRNLRYNEWLLRKQNEANKKRELMLMVKKEKDNEIETKRLEKQQAAKAWREWLEKKNQQEKEDRKKKVKENDETQKEKVDKRFLSEKKFKEWVKNAANRPRPVRSNLGFASLSCTNIGYVNPIPWKGLVDDDSDSFSKTLMILYKKPSRIGLNLAESSSTLPSLTEENCFSIRRTADWVRDASQQVLPKPTKLVERDELEMTSSNTSGGVIRFGRNRSAPIFLDKTIESDIENDKNVSKSNR